MFKEMRGLEYTLEALRAFHCNPGKHDSKSIYELIQGSGRVEASLTYVQKILPRMVKHGLLLSSESGYSLLKPISETTVADILNMCDMPEEDAPLYRLCHELKSAVAVFNITKFYDFTSS